MQYNLICVRYSQIFKSCLYNYFTLKSLIKIFAYKILRMAYSLQLKLY